jgi:hypothetical protein
MMRIARIATDGAGRSGSGGGPLGLAEPEAGVGEVASGSIGEGCGGGAISSV